MRQNDKKKKIRLGKKTEEGYKYSANIDFSRGEDVFTQIERFEREIEVKEKLEEKVSELESITKNYSLKKENIDYYCEMGKRLQFLDRTPFKEVEKYSVFRLIYEMIPGILPHIEDHKVAEKHIASMFFMGKVDRSLLKRASWAQWYEILKFKEIYKNRRLLEKILIECEKGLSDRSLRNRIKELH
jgi:hypothetical protein